MTRAHNWTGTEYRINPRTQTEVEKKLPSGRWQLVKRCDSRASARALLRYYAGRQPQER